jgi:hypothetical protein
MKVAAFVISGVEPEVLNCSYKYLWHYRCKVKQRRLKESAEVSVVLNNCQCTCHSLEICTVMTTLFALQPAVPTFVPN